MKAWTFLSGNRSDFNSTGDLTLQPGQTYTYTSDKVINQPGDYSAWISYFIAGDGLINAQPNGSDNAFTTFFVGGATSVDMIPPSVTLTAISPGPINDNTPTFTGTATDTKSNIKSIEYSIDDGLTWHIAQASDGSFDEKNEDYTFTTSPLLDGSYEQREPTLF